LIACKKSICANKNRYSQTALQVNVGMKVKVGGKKGKRDKKRQEGSGNRE
jgi:hypothetical protein